MTNSNHFDVIIIGGSYAGLSAGMSLGRALRNVLIIDSGKPCNRQTPHSHNFLTQDGQTPQAISTLAREQVAKYSTVQFLDGLATSGVKKEKGFEIGTQAGDLFTAKKLVFATGVRDVMPDIKGFAGCWGISVIHCPYCHGYEVRHEKTGILANGDIGFEFARLISNWTRELTLFTNGPSTLTEEQRDQLFGHQIGIIETEIDHLEHQQGYLQHVALKDNRNIALKAMYARPVMLQHCDIPAALGCELNEQGLIKVDMFQKTTVPGVYACGDSCQPARAVATAVSTGTFAGASLNRELIEERF
ncbi:NAD(P)/FAD-dependent oxidoreductase [Chitinophaga japonensis]|uniref:Thioredoxin reductase n=1 Tax=Chitinophaga japonensis TaxID=104662 RepID=A0A562T649_CHIJA|nr:NAD(P)/FAD-dependent oxidoreductase [Chitinophaga japonensis]TWI89017.1 thioredoxin reductase [Chitinophaga japonensis]